MTLDRDVIAGLDPAIHLHAKKMDPRVKPAGDENAKRKHAARTSLANRRLI